MKEIDILNAELAFHRIKIEGDTVSLFDSNGKLKEMPYQEALENFRQEARKSSEILKTLWERLKDETSNLSENLSEHEPKLERLFLSAIYYLYHLCHDSEKMHSYSLVIEDIFQQDIAHFSSETLAKIVEYRLAIEWLRYSVENAIYKTQMLRFHKMLSTKTLEVQAEGGGTTGGVFINLDLPEAERKWLWSDEEDNYEQEDKAKRTGESNNFRYTRHKWDETRQGLYYWPADFGGSKYPGEDVRNEPTEWEDWKKDSPYPSDVEFNR